MGIDGVRCRLAVRGFNDKFQDFDTYVGATSWSGQRLAKSVAAECFEFTLFRFDVGQACAKNGIRRI